MESRMQDHFYTNQLNVQKRNKKQIDHEELKEQLAFVETYDEALEIALRFIEENKGDREVLFVSHPISAAQEKTIEAQLQALQKTIDQYDQAGYFVFNQIPFHNSNLKNLKEKDIDEKFEKFFTPLLTSGRFDEIVFADLWQQSSGCQREYEIVKNLKIKKSFIDAKIDIDG